MVDLISFEQVDKPPSEIRALVLSSDETYRMTCFVFGVQHITVISILVLWTLLVRFPNPLALGREAGNLTRTLHTLGLSEQCIIFLEAVKVDLADHSLILSALACK